MPTENDQGRGQWRLVRNTKTEQSAAKSIPTRMVPARTLGKTLGVNTEKWSLDNSNWMKSFQRGIHLAMEEGLSVFAIKSFLKDSSEARAGTFITFVNDTKLRGFWDHRIIELKFKNSVALNYELKEASKSIIIKFFTSAQNGRWRVRPSHQVQWHS